MDSKRSWSGILLICFFSWSLDRIRLVVCIPDSSNLFNVNNNNNYVDTSFCVSDRKLILEQSSDALCHRAGKNNGTGRSK